MDTDEKSISNLDLAITNTKHNEESTSPDLSHTLSILTDYGLPKTSQYYSSKGKICALDKHYNEIAQSFIDNDINIHKLYSSSITSSQFVSDIMQYINNANDLSDTSLQTAIKKLYTVLQLHQHIQESMDHTLNENTTIDIEIGTALTLQRKNNRKRRRIDNMVRQLSRSQSEIFSLQQKNDILKEVADETQKKLMETEEKEYEYKHTVNVLQSTQSQINNKMIGLEHENQELKRLLAQYEHKYAQNQNRNDLELIEEDSEDSEDEGDKEQQLMVLNDEDIANITSFYRNTKVKKANDINNDNKSSKNFWERFLDGLLGRFECIPSFN